MTSASIYLYLVEYINPTVYKADDLNTEELADPLNEWVLPLCCGVIYAAVVFMNPFLEKGNQVCKKLIPVFYVLFVYFFIVFLTYFMFNCFIKPG